MKRRKATIVFWIFVLVLALTFSCTYAFSVPNSKSSGPKLSLEGANEYEALYVGAHVQDYLVERVWDNNWKQLDPLTALQQNGVEWIQVRLTTVSNPEMRGIPPEEWSNLPGHYYDYYHSGSLEYVEQILKEASDRGMRLNLVFYLSYHMAYAWLQDTPPEWQNLTIEELTITLNDYCYETTKYFMDNGLNIEIYDIGNEIEMGILDYLPGVKVPLPEGVNPSENMSYMKNNVWNIEASLLKSAISGVKEADPDAKITLHATGLQNEVLVKTFFQTMVEQGVEFDYAGLSFPAACIPDWVVRYHDDPFSWVQPTIDFLESLDKKVIFSEFTYPNDPKGVGGIPWTPSEPFPTPPKWETHVPVPGYPFSPEGQAKWVRDFLFFCRNSDAIIGAFYYGSDGFPGQGQGTVIYYPPGEYIGLFASDTQPQPAISQFKSNPPSFPTVNLVDETNADVTLVEETDPSFVWSGNWESDSGGSYSGGTRMGSGQAGAQVDIHFTGTGVSLLYMNCHNHGIAEIAVDGVPYPDIDMYAPEPSTDFPIPPEKVIAINLTPSEHVLTITVSGEKNPSSSSTFIVVDAVQVLHASSSSPFVWSANWELDIDIKYSGDTSMGSSEPDACASLTFTGTGVALIYTTSGDHGIAEVEVDGNRYPDIDMYSPEPVFRVTDIIATDLAPSEHVLTITVSGEKNASSSDDFVVVDAVDVICACALSQEWTVGVNVGDWFTYEGTLVLWEAEEGVPFPPHEYALILEEYNATDWYTYTVTDITGSNVTFNIVTHWSNGTETFSTLVDDMTGIFTMMVIGANLDSGTQLRDEYDWGFMVWPPRILNETIMVDLLSEPREMNVLDWTHPPTFGYTRQIYRWDKEFGIQTFYQVESNATDSINGGEYAYVANFQLVDSSISTLRAPSIIINDGDIYTTSTSVTLTLSATNETSGASEMRFSNNGADWTSWEAYTTSKSWTLPTGDGTKTVYVQFKDNTGLVSTTYSDTIILDTASPTGSIIINDGDIYTTSTSVTLTLTASDTTSGVYQVRYSDDGVWDTESWETPASTKNWTLAAGDGTKTVYYQVKDNAGLLSSSYLDAILLDTTAPSGSILINGGAATTSSASVTLSLTYSDSGSGVFQVRYSNDGTWDTEAWESPSATEVWTLTAGDGTKTVYYQVKDTARLTSPTYSDSIVLDTTVPTGSIVINNDDASTTSTSVTLSLTYADSDSGVSQVRYSNDNNWDTEPWDTPVASKSWTLTAGDGTKTVYYQIRDNAGNVATYSDTTILDTTAPSGSIIIKGGDASTISTSVTLTLTYTDVSSGVSQVRYSNDGVWDTETWETPTATKAWALTSGDGTKTVYYQIKDNAGLLSSTYSDTISLQSPSPSPSPSLSPSPQPTPPSSTPSPSISPSPTPSFTPQPTESPSPPPTEESSLLSYAIVAGAVFAAVGAAAFLLKRKR